MKERFQRFREIRALPSASLRIYFFAFLMIAGLGVLSAKLWQEQTTNSAKWRARIRKGGEVTVRIPSVRGDILDRNGWVLAENRPSFSVDIYFPQMVEAMKETVKVRNKAKIAEAREAHRRIQPGELEELPTIETEGIRDGMLKKVRPVDVVSIINTEVIPKLFEMNLTGDNPALSLDYNASEVETHYRAREHVPFTFLPSPSFPSVTAETVAKISEHDFNLPGVEVSLRPDRHYLYKSFACHMLGYVGKPEDEDKEKDYFKGNGDKTFDYYKADIVGRSSLEKFCNEWLRGKPGKRILERSAKGKTGAEKERIEPTPGNNVYLTIDARIQMMAEKTLRESGVGRAGVVVVDPNNGDILAMASVPNYDANQFASITKAQLDALSDDKTNPLISRCIESYPPGSTYKQVTALAILRAGVSPKKTWTCTGGFSYGGRLMKCTGSHGSLDLVGAIKKSCNSYFYQITNYIGDGLKDGKGPKDGFTQLEAVGEALGLGMTSGLEISGEDPGVLPGPKYYTSKGLLAEMDSRGQLANASIGQGKVIASPLQMAMVTATLANGGKSYFPRLISRVVDSERNDVRKEDGNLVIAVEPRLRANLLDLGLSANDIEVVRKGMWEVVNGAGGTGGRAKIKGIEVAGKTGTAQAFRLGEKDETGKPKKEDDNRVWFCSFAPYKEPKYAICVMVESGGKTASGGKVAAPIATKIMKEALALIALDKKDEADTKFRPDVLAAVAGNFNPISEVKVSDDGSLSKIVATAFDDQKPGVPRADDDDRVDHDNDAPVAARKRATADIAAKKAADARGTMKPSAQPVRHTTWFERAILGRKPTHPATGTPARPR